MSESRRPSLRERTRLAVREQIAEAALLLFDEQGFEETTVDQIAAAVDISPRSFFRYFTAKEDVVLGDPMVHGAVVREALAQHVETVPLWHALRASFEFIVTITDADPEGTLRAMRVMIGTPALRARSTEKHLAWMLVLVPIVEDALTGAKEDRGYRARAITLAALTCLDATSAEWVRRDGTIGYGPLLDQAFTMLEPAALRS